MVCVSSVFWIWNSFGLRFHNIQNAFYRTQTRLLVYSRTPTRLHQLVYSIFFHILNSANSCYIFCLNWTILNNLEFYVCKWSEFFYSFLFNGEKYYELIRNTKQNFWNAFCEQNLRLMCFTINHCPVNIWLDANCGEWKKVQLRYWRAVIFFFLKSTATADHISQKGYWM